jgi:hypothetical protein
MSDEAPKSAYELAMARLRQKDREAGLAERPLTEEHRARIAEVRQFYEAKLAEVEILHRSALAKAADEDALAEIEQQYRRDRERLIGERERKLTQLREEG